MALEFPAPEEQYFEVLWEIVVPGGVLPLAVAEQSVIGPVPEVGSAAEAE